MTVCLLPINLFQNFKNKNPQADFFGPIGLLQIAIDGLIINHICQVKSI